MTGGRRAELEFFVDTWARAVRTGEEMPEDGGHFVLEEESPHRPLRLDYLRP